MFEYLNGFKNVIMINLMQLMDFISCSYIGSSSGRE